MLKAYKYRLLPTPEQAAKLDAGMNACRFIYNLALETKIRAWESARVSLSAYDLHKQLSDLKKSGLANWLNLVSGHSLQAAIIDMDSAFKNLFKGAGYPKYKKKQSSNKMLFRDSVKIIGSCVNLQKYGLVEFVQHRKIPADSVIRRATVSKTSLGKYMVSVLVDTQILPPAKKDISLDTCVGVDLGIKSFATLSNGDSAESPKYLRATLHYIQAAQRKLSRRYVKGKKISEQSKGWHRQRMVVAKLHEKVANQRADFLHKLSDSITKNYDTVCVEDLHVSGMIKNRRLSMAISDASWGEFLRQLKYKSEWRGKNLIEIGRFEPSSKTCSNCGWVNDDLNLSVRSWNCECGAVHDRDVNAAINIKRIGLEMRPSTVNVAQ